MGEVLVDGREVISIDAGDVSTRLDPSQLWRHRELLFLFIKRGLSSRYRQMALGSIWVVLEPLAQLLLLSAVFGAILRVDTGGYPYPIYAFSGLIPWWLFSRTTMSVAGCLQDNLSLISKVYFPRILLALAAAARDFVDSLVALALLLAVSIYYGYIPTKKVLLAPVIMAMVSVAAFAVGLWVASLMVKFRDIRPLLGVVLQAGMYLSPILYSADLVPVRHRFSYELNPMYWGVEGFRWILIDKHLELSEALPFSFLATCAMLFVGLKVFAIQERQTIDVQ